MHMSVPMQELMKEHFVCQMSSGIKFLLMLQLMMTAAMLMILSLFLLESMQSVSLLEV